MLDALRVPFIAAPLLVILFALLEAWGGRPSPWLIVHGLSSTATASVLWWRRGPIAVRRVAFVAGCTVAAGCVLFHYGPLLGTGVFFMGATLAAAYFTGRRGAMTVIAVLLVLVGVTAWGSRAGWLFPTYTLPTRLAWIRLAVGATFALAACGYLFDRVQLMRRKAVKAEAAALRSQEQAQREREQLLQQSTSAQRLEAVGRLAGGVAHDFNNALMVIVPTLELLQKSPTVGVQDQVLLREMGAAARHAESTCQALLAFARSRPEDVGTSEPAVVLRRFAASLGRLLTERVAVDVQVSDTPPIPLSEPALEQVLMNLVVNARDAMTAGGTLRLCCRTEAAEGAVVIEVADTGTGMSDEVRARVFEPFFTTKEQGTGLGLPMVWGVVTRAGGSIQVLSRPGEGTRVQITLKPAEAAVPRTTAPPPQTTAPTPAPGRRVLLLDDDPLVQRALKRILEHGGYKVTAFERAGPAREAALQEKFHALVTDAMVPDGGVPALIDAFRQANPGATILVCSGHVEEELVSLGVTRGDYRFLRKPVDIDEFLAALSTPAGAPAPATA